MCGSDTNAESATPQNCGVHRLALPMHHQPGDMLRLALAFFVVAIIAAVFGFGGIASGAAGIAKILFFVFIVIAVVSLIAGFLRR